MSRNLGTSRSIQCVLRVGRILQDLQAIQAKRDRRYD